MVCAGGSTWEVLEGRVHIFLSFLIFSCVSLILKLPSYFLYVNEVGRRILNMWNRVL